MAEWKADCGPDFPALPDSSLVEMPISIRGDGFWDGLKLVYPDEFALPLPSDMQDWHYQAALRNEGDRDWFAAAFHYYELYLANPEQAHFSRSLALAKARAGHWTEMAIAHPELHPTIRPRLPGTPPELLDLSPFYNVFLNENWNPETSQNHTLASLPTGSNVLGGVQFDARGIVQLHGGVFRDIPRGHFPDQVRGIPVAQLARRLHFLHATVYRTSAGNEIGAFMIHFETGQTQAIPIIYGSDVQDWADKADDFPVAWSDKGNSIALRLYKTTWVNPFADRAIAAVDYVSAMTQCAPFLVAITVER